jgi:hypothetical protein
MNRLPSDMMHLIFMYAFDEYFDAFNAFLIVKFQCNLKIIKQHFLGHSITYIYCTYNDKTVDELYETIMMFNLKHQYPITIKQSLAILNFHLKKI